MNLILFPKLQLSLFPEIKSHHIKILCCLFTYCQCSPNFCYHHIMISITVSSPKILYIECTQMSSVIYQCVINVVVSLPTRRGPGVFMIFWCRNIMLLKVRFFYVAKFVILTQLQLLSWCSLSFSVVSLKMSSLPSFVLKSSTRIFVWYWGKWSKTCSYFP